MKIFRAYYDSRNFCFEAFDQSEELARALVMKGLVIHTKEYNLGPDWWSTEGIECDSYELGQTYRDREEL